MINVLEPNRFCCAYDFFLSSGFVLGPKFVKSQKYVDVSADLSTIAPDLPYTY